MSASAYQEMGDVLTRLAEVYTQIENVLNLEREALIVFDFESLPKLTEQKENLTYEVHRLEAEREELFEDLALTFQLSERPVKIAKLIPSLPKSVREKLNVLTKTLEEKTTSCLNVFRANQRFIEMSLKNIDALRENYQRNLQAPSSTYSRAGKVETATPTVVRKKV
jgi:flagellar biosynthesis/type III secretory pathway chaperone